MSRSQALEAMKSHPMLQSLFRRLTLTELTELETFVKEREHLSADDYANDVNRWYLDKPEKPKHLSDMWAIALQAEPSKQRRHR